MIVNSFLLILIPSRSRTLLGTKTDFCVTTANESQPQTVVTKNFILAATDVLDPRLSRLEYARR